MCGGRNVRMKKVSGRTDDCSSNAGERIPLADRERAHELKEVEPQLPLLVDREDNLDTLTVMVEIGEAAFSDEVRILQSIEKKIAKNIKEYLGVSAKVKLVEPKSIARSEGKAQRVIDKRKI